ncbi:DUF6875 domain-containing protein [Amycolatopsis sp. NPDC051102]|uniref:DUF6875 domain-containing protein n=1 Tax=Amycolatopsis sp. NPDC051102 TaxID=3155163 RepID=UPI00341FCD3F
MTGPDTTFDAADVVDDPTAPEWAVRTAEWIRDEVAAPAPALGRAGALCPYIPAALRRRQVVLVECRLSGADPAALDSWFLARAARFRREASARPPAEALLSCLVVVYTTLTGNEALVTGVRERVKPRLLAEGLTTGEFFPRSPDTSVRNAGFPVARAPWPALALRHSTPHDELFLAGQPPLHRIFQASGPGIDPGTVSESLRPATADPRETR